jgi:hypothetical protein
MTPRRGADVIGHQRRAARTTEGDDWRGSWCVVLHSRYLDPLTARRADGQSHQHDAVTKHYWTLVLSTAQKSLVRPEVVKKA